MTNLSIITAGIAATAIVNRAQLTRAMEAAAKVVEKRNKLPILGNVRLQAIGADKLAVVATDEDIEIEILVDAEAIDSRFDVTVPCKTLADLTKKAGSGATLVTLSAAPTVVTREEFEAAVQAKRPIDVSATMTAVFGSIEYKLTGMQSCAFPELAGDDVTHEFQMSGTTFWSALDAVRGAISTEETRYYLNGVFMHRADKEIRFAATDGHRLYTQNFDAPGGTMGMDGAIIPRKTVDLVHALTKGKAAPSVFSIQVSASGFFCRFGSISIRSKLIDGTFPDYNRVIPTRNEVTARFASVALTEAVKAVTALSSDRGRPVKLEFSENACRISMRSDGEGTAAAITIGCEYGGAEFEIGFNARYLLSLIETACPAEEKLTMKLSDAGSPTLFRGASPRFTGVLMPMRV